MKSSLLAIMLVALSACAEGDAPDPDPVPGENGYNMIDPVEDPIADSGPVAQGQWRRERIDGRPALRFTGEGSPAIAIFCDQRDGLVFEIMRANPTPPIEMLRISSAGASGVYAVRPIQESGRLRAAIPAADQMITALSQGRTLRIDFGSDRARTLPAGPMVPELIAQCRGSEAEPG